jgi:hypothetical protein
MASYRFRAAPWLWTGNGASSWHFVTVPFDVADDIDERTTGRQGGFGSVRVRATIGSTSWHTSLFPSKEAESYLLPVKRAVRDAEGLVVGTDADVQLTVVHASAEHSVEQTTQG